MKKLIKTLLFLTIFPLAGCNFDIKENKYEVLDIEEVPIEHNYDEIKDYEITFDSIFDPTDNIYFVYFYSLTCSHCEELKNFMIEKALEMKNIYFLKASNQIIQKDDVYSTIGAEKPGDIAILGYPSLLKIEANRVTKNVAGKTAIKELLNK